MRKEIIFTGFGGQGIILMGVIIARMMEHFPDLQVTQAQSYGPASRGGACRTDVVISDQRINYPKSSRPDIMIFMSEEARKRLLGEADPETGWWPTSTCWGPRLN
jgi:2-oxoglutarate ferredoxin oxidoreductase subunit gamma